MIKIFGCASIPVTIAMSGFLTLAVPFAFEWIGSEVASAQREAAEKTRREEEEKRKATQEEAERKSAQEAAEREGAKRQSLQDVTMQTLVPLPGQETILKTDKTPEWADATSYAVRQGNVIVSVTDLKQADYLQIQLSVKSIAKEPLLFKGWGTAEGNVPAFLQDSSGRTLTAARERLPALAFSPRLVVPDQSITNWIAFDGSVR